MSRIANIEYKTSYCPYCCGNVIIVDGVAECQHCDYFDLLTDVFKMYPHIIIHYPDESYCEIAARRIEEASKQHALFEGLE